MASLADLASGAPPQTDAIGDMMAYRKYVIACSEMGRSPLPFDQWVAAGKPPG
jgi:hypothetical protein